MEDRTALSGWNAGLVFAIGFVAGVQPAETGDEKETEGIRTATPHEFPARVGKILENEHANSYHRGD